MTVKLNKNKISPSLEEMEKKLGEVPKKAYKFFKKQTPKRSGNARRKTKFRNGTIVADYPYAKPLDSGHSKKAPKGMTEPTQVFWEKLVRKIMRKK